MDRRVPVEPTLNATESNVCSRGRLRIVAATARIAGLILLIVGLISPVTGMSPTYAGEDGLTWVVAQATGDVRYRSGGNSPTKWQELRVGDVVGAAAEIRTGRNSRVVLGHRQTTMTATAESRVALPGGSGSNGAYRVLQSLGTLLYRIKERAASMAAFEVETPYLVALVKGTIFTVNVSAEEASVELSEGVVRVQPTRGGKGIMLAAGQTARVTRASGTDVIINGRGADRRSSVKPQAPTRLAMANTQRTGPGGGADEDGQAPGASPEGGNPGGGGTGDGTDVCGSVGGGDPGGGHVARSDWSQDTAGSPTIIWSLPSMVGMETAAGWMAEIWAAVMDNMGTWVGAVLLLVMWALVWVAVSTLRIRSRKLPSRDAAAMARDTLPLPIKGKNL